MAGKKVAVSRGKQDVAAAEEDQPTNGGAAGPVMGEATPEEIADFVADTLDGLRDMASHAGLDVLAYMLEMTRLEAQDHQ